jgi:osmoprotectant transport system permease protein
MDQIVDRTWQHLGLTAVSVGLGLLISVGLALVALRWRWTYSPITWVTGLLYTIPSLALFALLVPIVGLNATNAVIALTSYTLLIIIRNLVAGIDGVPESVLEAADGMGYTPQARFWRMEVPLALPAIIAGLRIATVTTVGLVTVTAVLGLGGYGFFIRVGSTPSSGLRSSWGWSSPSSWRRCSTLASSGWRGCSARGRGDADDRLGGGSGVPRRSSDLVGA